jgi:hypothetical protein
MLNQNDQNRWWVDNLVNNREISLFSVRNKNQISVYMTWLWAILCTSCYPKAYKEIGKDFRINNSCVVDVWITFHPRREGGVALQWFEPTTYVIWAHDLKSLSQHYNFDKIYFIELKISKMFLNTCLKYVNVGRLPLPSNNKFWSLNKG